MALFKIFLSTGILDALLASLGIPTSMHVTTSGTQLVGRRERVRYHACTFGQGVEEEETNGLQPLGQIGAGNVTNLTPDVVRSKMEPSPGV